MHSEREDRRRFALVVSAISMALLIKLTSFVDAQSVRVVEVDETEVDLTLTSLER